MIETERLLLRGWREEDASALQAIRADPRVAATLGPAREPTPAIIARQNAGLAARGYGFLAVGHRADCRLAGWCGIQPGFGPLEGETEIGWMIAPDLWGRGLAHEAAAAVLAWAWASTALDRIVAITNPANLRSRRLMERLGLHRLIDRNFDHPALGLDDPLRAHVTYAIDRPA